MSESIRNKRIGRNALAYLAGAWVLLQVLDFLSHNFGWPPLLVKEATVIAASGLLVTLVVTWYHGERGEQRVRPGEIALYALIIAATAVLGWKIAGDREPSKTRVDSSLAVLPFENIGAKPENQYISDGLTEELLNSLADVVGVRVVPRSSSFQVGSGKTDAAVTGRKLNASYLVTGSVQRAGEKLRVIARLISAGDGAQLWTEKYDRSAADLFTVETEIATDVVGALRAKIGSSIGVAPAATHVPSEKAHDLYLKGRFALSKGVPDALQQSLTYFQEAMEADPLYALAYSGQAESYLWLADAVLEPNVAYPRVKRAASKALELDPNLLEAKMILPLVTMVYDWKFDDAERQFRQLLRDHPGSSQLLMYHAGLQITYDPPAALASLRHALELDPLSGTISGLTELFMVWAGEFDQAIRQHEVTKTLDPHFWFLSSALGDAYREKRMFDKAIAAYKEEEAVIGRPSTGLAVTYARMGRKSEALKIAKELERLRASQYIAADRIACIYGALGDQDDAFRWLDKGVRERDTWITWIKGMQEFNEIRSDRRYRELLNKVGMKE